MTDEELPDRAEIASAYLDGEIEPDERARAEADPETMALVQSFRSLRTTLADAPPASMADRAAGLSAGLAEYDALAPMRRLTPLSELEPRRHHRNRWVLSAAAAVVVLVVVISVVAAGGSNGKKTASEPRTTITVATGSPTTKAATAPSDTLAMEAATASQAPASDGGSADATAPTPINSPAALRTFAESTPSFAAKTPALGVSAPPCLASGDTVLGSITFLNIPALAVLDGANGNIKALASSDCRQLISVSP